MLPKPLLKFEEKLRPGIFLKRYKRFFVDVLLENNEIEAVHCPNSGSMKSCLEERVPVFTLDSRNETRKLRHTLELMKLQDGYACLNTQRANQLVEKFLICYLKNQFPKTTADLSFFSKWTSVHREVPFNKHTRFDFCLLQEKNKEKKYWIEVKSVSLKLEDGSLAFPDAVTERGQKHLIELMHAKDLGFNSALFFVVMRSTKLAAKDIADHFRIAKEIDSQYNELYLKAKKHGVRLFLFVSDIHLTGFDIRDVFEL